jgi:hypothetical protein
VTISKAWAIGIGVALAAVLLLGCYELLQEREAAARLEVVSADAKKDLAIAQQTMAARDKADAAQQMAAHKTAAAVITAPQAVKIITQYVPVAAANATPGQAQAVTVQKPDLSAHAQSELPDAPSYAVMTQAEAVATAKRLILCDGNDKSLEACRADMATVKQSLTVETATAEQCKTALKGGTFWQRLKSDAVKITIAGAIGVVAGYAAHR